MIVHQAELMHAYLIETGRLPKFLHIIKNTIKRQLDEELTITNIMRSFDPTLEKEQIERIWTGYLIQLRRDVSTGTARNEI